MGSVGIKGIEILSIDLKLRANVDNDKIELIEGVYGLVSSLDKVIAKQGFNSQYGDNMKVQLSKATLEARIALLASLKSDIEAAVGLV